ncbi:MAG: protein kinase, partial [Verrucomicrobiales bacterium]|nr:protein kinase [Verrucomicrobiales bacterium]
VGGGSYGEVWLARTVTGCMRAVKVVWRRNFSSERPYEREFRGIVQFEPISRAHPGVVNVLHVGRDDMAGCFFYVMELADDASVAALVRARADSDPAHALTSVATYIPHTLSSDLKARGRLPVPEVLRLGVQLADALGHLQRHGLVHRDVKPSNVIFVGGQAKLADIGLVTGVDEARSFVGTEGFIPPEGPGSERADLFSLGRLLYEAGTGMDRCDFPNLPADLDRWPDAEREGLLELNEVLARACAPEPAKRHANSAELAGDLNLILAGRSVRRAYGVERRLRRATQVSVAAIAVLALAAGLVWFQGSRQRQAEASAARERSLRERAEVAERESRQQLYTALLEQARANRLSREFGQRVATLDAVRRASALSNSAELRREAFAALALPDLRFEREVPFEASETGKAFDPAFERFAVGRGRGPVEVRAVSDRRLLAALPPAVNREAHLMCWSPDGQYLAIKRDYDPAGSRADLEVWNLVSTQRVLFARDRLTGNAMSFHPRLPRIMAGRNDGDISVFDLQTAQEIHELNLGADPYSLRFSPDGERFAASYDLGRSNAVVICDVASAAPLVSNVGPHLVTMVAWHPQGRWLAALDHGGNVRLVDPKTGAGRLLGQHKLQAVEAAFSPDGNFLITAGWERELICWDLRSLQRAFTIGINSYLIQFRRDGRQCVICTTDRAKLYEFQPPTCYRPLDADLGRAVLYGAFSPDGQWFAATGDLSLGVWNLRTGGLAATVPIGQVRIPFFSPKASELYAYGRDSLGRWEMTVDESGESPQLTKLPLLVPPGLRGASVLSNELVLTSRDGVNFMPLDNVDPANLRHLKKADGWGQVSPDERWLGLRTPSSPLLRVYRLPEVERAAWLTNHTDVWTFAFSPRGDELVVVTRAGLEFYDTSTWQRTRELAVPCERQASILFAPDGEAFWCTSDVRTGAMRSTRTLEVLLPLPSGILPLALSADGRHLAVSVDTRDVQVWDLAEVKERFRDLGVDWTRRLEF